MMHIYIYVYVIKTDIHICILDTRYNSSRHAFINVTYVYICNYAVTDIDIEGGCR